MYPVLTNPVTNLRFDDQYAFRPTGSTTAALIAISNHILNTLGNEPYVRLVSLDFSKAFDSVRHSHLAEQLASLPIPDHIYNWIMNLLQNRSHCTKFRGEISLFVRINASIIQGSGLGPVDFVVAISDLKPINNFNRIFKYADDCYLAVPASGISTTQMELEHISLWARKCNLSLNSNKSSEIIFTRSRGIINVPPPLNGIVRVQTLNIFGVELTQKFGFSSHIKQLIIKARQSYALWILRAHGLSGDCLFDVVRSTTIGRMLYCSPVWWGFAGVQERETLEGIIRRLVHQGYLPHSSPTFKTLCDKAEASLCSHILRNPCHVLHKLLPPIKHSFYSMRPRPHNRELPRFDTLSQKCFFARMLYK